MKEEKVYTFIKNGPFVVKEIAKELGVDYANFINRVNGKLFTSPAELKRVEQHMKQYGFKKSKT